MANKKKSKPQSQIYQGGINIKGNVEIKNSKVAGRDNIEKNVTNITYSFAPIYDAIKDRENTLPETKIALEENVKQIEQEVKKGASARDSFILKRLENIQKMAPDIGEVAIAAMLNPALGISLAIKKVVSKYKEEIAK